MATSSSARPLLDGPTKRKFSALRCVWNSEPDKDIAPFATLTITCHRASDLLSADVTGLSDPYLVLSLDGADLKVKTKTQKQTLAPVWQETFEIEVYHPLSVLTVTIWDEDFGTALKGIDLFGLDDDMIGWTDLRVGRLPHNEAISSWIPLHHPDSFQDSVKGRVSHMAKRTPQTYGRILLSMKLDVKHSWHEFFASCLETPTQGHGLPELNLGSIFEGGIDLQQTFDSWTIAAQKCTKDVFSHPMPLWILSACIAYWPAFLLPAVLLAVPIVLFRISRKNQTQSNQDGKDAEKAEADALAAKETETKALAAKLSSIQSFIPQDSQLDLRLGAENIAMCRGQFHFVERVGQNKLISPICCLTAVFFIIFRDVQCLILQAGFFLGATGMLFPYTVFYRLGLALWYQRLGPKRIAKPDMFKDETSSPSSLARGSGGGSECWKLTAEGHALLSIHSKGTEGGTWSPRKNSVRQQHQHTLTSFREATWCKSCGGFLWGVRQQGYRCKCCGKTVCQPCAADSNEDPCFGKESV